MWRRSLREPPPRPKADSPARTGKTSVGFALRVRAPTDSGGAAGTGSSSFPLRWFLLADSLHHRGGGGACNAPAKAGTPSSAVRSSAFRRFVWSPGFSRCFAVVCSAAPRPLYFAASAASMAVAISGASGFMPGSKRARIFPSRPTRNFPKFHFTAPGTGELFPESAS